MNKSVTINKREVHAKSLDFEALRKEGMELIQQFSGKTWTDHNLHDPGITMLEVLCYALTELGYKTAFDIKDLLAEKPGEVFQNSHQFFTARQILTSHPVTVADYRKLLIDIPGIKNAWLSPVKSPEPPLWVNCKKSALQHEKDLEHDADGNLADPALPVKLRGLYNIRLELDADPDTGDLNTSYVEIPIRTSGENFTMVVLLPSWDYFMKQQIAADDLVSCTLTSLTEVDRTRFTALLTLVLTDRTEQLNIRIHSSAKSTAARIALMVDKLAKTGKESVCELFLQRTRKALQITGQVWQKLHDNRNLCEDFNQLLGLEIEEVALCADLEMSTDADNEKALAEVYYQIARFIAPPFVSTLLMR